MSNTDPELVKLFERMRRLGFHKNITIITTKAKPMTQAEIDAANNHPCRGMDYIGLLK